MVIRLGYINVESTDMEPTSNQVFDVASYDYLTAAKVATHITQAINDGIVPLDAWQESVVFEVIHGKSPTLAFFKLVEEYMEDIALEN